VKSDIRLPVLYGALVAVELGWRAVAWLRKASSRRPSALRRPSQGPVAEGAES
jgi:hypothetical protein